MTKKKAKKKSKAAGLSKYRSAIKRNKSVSSAERLLKKAEARVNALKRKKANAVKKAARAYRKKHGK